MAVKSDETIILEEEDTAIVVRADGSLETYIPAYDVFDDDHPIPQNHPMMITLGMQVFLNQEGNVEKILDLALRAVDGDPEVYDQ